MVTTKLNLSMTEPQVRQIYAKQGDTGRVLDITLDQTPEDGTLRILRPDGVEVTSEAVTGGSSESGETVTFDSMTEADVTELTVGIEPVQDLNGYDAPWVGGAGKNKLNYDAWKTVDVVRGTAVWENNGVTLTATNIDCYTEFGGTFPNDAKIEVREGETITLAWDATPTDIGIAYIFPNAQPSGVVSEHSNVGHLSYTVASGVTYLTFRFGVTNPGVTASYKNIQIVRGTTVPTWTPYSNICPITGHDEVTVTRTGKNLARIRDVDATFSGITWQSDGASIRVKGTATSNSSPFTASQTTNFDNMLNGVYPAGTYTVSCRGWEMSQTADRMTANAKYADGTGVSGVDGLRITPSTVGGQPNDRTFTATKPFKMDFWCYIQSGSTVDFTATIQLELGSTATAYEPYQSNTYTTSLGQTVYGGTLDMVSGVLTVDRAMVSLSGSDLNIGSSQTKELNMWRLPLNNPCGTLASSYPSGISNKYVMRNSYNGVNNNNGSLGLNQTSGSQILIRDDSLTTAQEVIDAFNSTPLTFVYPLATPQTYTLTAQQIKTLVGTNNVWASSGDIVSITFTYGGLLSELPSEATEIVGKCYCDVEQNGVSSMPFTLNVKKNERES